MFLPLLLQCSLFQVTGTTDETMSGNKVTAMVYNEDGAPAIGATVKIFQYGTTNLALKTETDTNGRYTFSGLNGTYSILAKKGGLVSFQDSAFIFQDKDYLKIDTLRKPSSFTAQVGIHPGDNYQSVTAELLGTDLFANVDAKGRLTLSGLAEGTYRLKLSTTMQNYTTTYFSIKIERNSELIYPDTLRMIYSGIPTVTGLKAVYDTLNGTMVVTWAPSDYFNFQEYLLFRQSDSSKALPAQPWKILTDTIFEDTIYDFQDRYTDSNRYSFQYRIKIRDKFDKEGNVFGFVRATAYPPSLVKTFLDFGIQDHQSDTLTQNDTVRIVVRLQNKTRNLRMVKWAIGKIDAVVRETELDSTRKTAADTLAYSWPTEGNYKIYAISKDIAGVDWVDSTQVYVIKDFPQISIANDTLVLTNSKIKLHATAAFRFSKISKWEWDIGNTGKFIQVSSSDTTITAPSTEQLQYLCILKATNDDGFSSKDTMRIQSKKIFITVPTGNEIISGIYKVHGIADPAISEIQVKIADNSWVIASGVSEWSANIETRLLFPKSSANISINLVENGSPDISSTIPIMLSNLDPIAGCWVGPSGSFCLNSGGWITGYPFGVDRFPDGWMRYSDNTIAISRSISPVTITITWIDYNSFIAKGSSYGDGTYTRQ